MTPGTSPSCCTLAHSYRALPRPDGFIKLSCADCDKIKSSSSPRKKIKQGNISGNVRELNIGRQYRLDRIQLTFVASG